MSTRIVWTIAGTDSGGGAGIAADQRAADACGVHLCTVVAAVTAQNSVAVSHVESMPVAVIEAQIAALEADMPPRAVKTGLLGGVAQIEAVARAVDRLRLRGPLPLVVDPVLGATSGASFGDDAVVAAYRRWLLPRASLLTPNRREALRLTGLPPGTDAPTLARALRAAGARAVCVTGGDDAAPDGLARDWLDTPHAAGWLALPRIATPHTHATGCTFAAAAAAAMAKGFVAADAAVLAKMAAAHALRHGHAAGQGAGPVKARAGFADDPTLMPQMSWSEAPRFAAFGAQGGGEWGAGAAAGVCALPPSSQPQPQPQPRSGPSHLYAIADSADRIAALLQAGVRRLQLRIKTPPSPDAAWHSSLQAQVRQAVVDCRAAGAQLFVNDHHALALRAGAAGLHLGQEDLLALGDAGRDMLRAPGAPALGISSHSLWELARARSLAPRYIACGPVWPTTTKAMPWRPQGLDNLAWWCRMAGAPVVAIGGILAPEQAALAAGCGTDAVCVVRGLGDDPATAVALFRQALDGAPRPVAAASGWPHPSLQAEDPAGPDSE
ncbi:bifunctional hydroxymethylpyrimidine kinase/phosphomethylpyrimidine kinase [Xylophilus ampelinus]|uniref:hydroxymethylpyrimidine kinase n=1 Tax=Xylophilus ampelinus TaxID=54067 RepID=A0A318SK24_9BURK|nr:bifunctional hydroxymethylpyrimidine kinase/phosphomethylpyrimidine kinase [Xylophilus ampelinus]MCS4510942.1 bifunctional hydroxymethylpyrimidine kinase/phosphomethylpyrimidine kinase [Xylophilus ampelinus]PYE76101.1 thiamine-phosphate diphosphorylase [Xylophilus ampelinus]